MRRIVVWLLAIPGAIVLAVGIATYVAAIRTGHHDSQHGGAMLQVASLLATLIGVVLVLLALVVRPRGNVPDGS